MLFINYTLSSHSLFIFILFLQRSLKNLEFSSLQLSVICSSSLIIPLFLDLLSESCSLCAFPQKGPAYPQPMTESQPFLAQQRFLSFTFMFFSPSFLATECPSISSEKGPILEKPQITAEGGG